MASQNQLDDGNGRITVLKSKIDVLNSQLTTTTTNLIEQSGTTGVNDYSKVIPTSEIEPN